MLHELTTSERRQLIAAARQAVTEAVSGQRSDGQEAEVPDIAVSGLFVTVHVQEALRGCIGFLEIEDFFARTLHMAAVRAATSDYRFPPITAEELADLTLDVTLLGPLQPLHDPENFEIGRHGLVLEQHGRRGLLLPQVAVEQGWNKTEFLEGLCRKTLVAPGSWKQPDAHLFRFEGMVIREDVDKAPKQTPRSGGESSTDPPPSSSDPGRRSS